MLVRGDCAGYLVVARLEVLLQRVRPIVTEAWGDSTDDEIFG
jgi:hypothetical protein